MPTVPTLNNTSNDSPREDIGMKPGHNHFHGIDCKFLVGPKSDTILGNRMIFALESAVFENMLCDNAAEIRLPDDNPQVFRNLRYVMYNKNPVAMDHFSLDDIVKVSQLSDTYKVLSVSQLCREYMKELLKTASLSDVLTAYHYAIKVNCKDTMKSADDFLTSKANENHHDFFNKISEYFIKAEGGGEGAAEQLSASDKTQDELLQRCLNLVDFGKMTVWEFTNGPGKSNILTSDQKYLLLTKMLATMPHQYQTSTYQVVIKLNQ